MAVPIISRGERDRLRQRLKDHMEECNLSSRGIARAIKQNQGAIQDSGSSDSIRRFLNEGKDPATLVSARTLGAITQYLEWYEHQAKVELAARQAERIAPDTQFIISMTHFFQEPTKHPTKHNLHGSARFGQRLVGHYACYRPAWRTFAANNNCFSGRIAKTLIEISQEGTGYRISETQDYASTIEQPDDYKQFDRGCLVSLGDYIYFLMKEMADTSVKFGVIKRVSWNAERPVDWFMGEMYVSSSYSFYPPARFFCRRVGHAGAVALGETDLDKIGDREAEVYLSSFVRLLKERNR
jgi:hypothetical protein